MVTRKEADHTPRHRRHRYERAIQAKLIRCGGETRVVTEDGNTALQSAMQNEPLLKAVARGRQYYQALTQGRFVSVKAIADQDNVPSSYISRLLRCGMLAPDLVEQLIDGTAAPQLNLKNVCEHLPLDWEAQRVLYGTATA